MLRIRITQSGQRFYTLLRPLPGFFRRPRIARVVRRAGQISTAGILALFAFGVLMTATMLYWSWVALAVVLSAFVPWLFSRAVGRWQALYVGLMTSLGVVVPLMALLGFDVLWSSLGIPQPAPEWGLIVAGVLIFAVAYLYWRWVGRPAPPHHRFWAGYAVVAAVGLAACTGQELQFGLVVTAAAAGAATWLYLDRTVGPRVKHPLWWAALLVVVMVVAAPLIADAVQGHRLKAALVVGGAVLAALIGLNGLWLPRDSDEWRGLRRVVRTMLVVGSVVVLTFVVARATYGKPRTPDENPLPVAGTATPLPRAAIEHRPIVLFDSGERFRTPLDVERMLATGDVELCPEGKGLLADCRDLNGVSDLRNGFGNLRFNTQTIEDDPIPTTIYARVVPDTRHDGWTDIDYWWYLPDNPANTAKGAMCGAGFVIPEITCFDHQSDWEGVTVVVDSAQSPVAVRYAAHEGVVNVRWNTLQTALAGKALRPYAAGRDVANRPLVFVARGTHAGYPLPCKSSVCDRGGILEDTSHDGAHEWPEQRCSPQGCVTAFPAPARGRVGTSWNGFDGRWGSAVCITEKFGCVRARAPRSPGRQDRFNRPWCFNFFVDGDLRKPRKVKPTPPECR
jgi:hypothetical protein